MKPAASQAYMLTGAAVLLVFIPSVSGWGKCAEAYCSSCPDSPKVCKECRDEATNDWMEPLGVYAGRDGKCHLCVERDTRCNACNGRTGACTFCGPNYGVNKRTGRCTRCASAQCASCGADSTVCNWCRTGYGVDTATGSCVKCRVPGCDPAYCGSDASACIQCKMGYDWINETTCRKQGSRLSNSKGRKLAL